MLRTSSLFTRPSKRTKEFSNRTCVFIRPMCPTFSLNRKFEATLPTIFIASVYSQIKECITENIRRHQPFQKLAQLFVVLQSKIFKPREFDYSMEIFAVESMSRQSYYRVFLLTLSFNTCLLEHTCK